MVCAGMGSVWCSCDARCGIRMRTRREVGAGLVGVGCGDFDWWAGFVAMGIYLCSVADWIAEGLLRVSQRLCRWESDLIGREG